jgi:hypothetical protein
MTSDPPAKMATLVAGESTVPRVTRSAVPAGKDYSDYRPYLRYDFFYSCAYCMITEAEASAIRFVIDHYEPRQACPELQHEYSNLMYACDPCNTLKGDRCPPAEARVAGLRFFRPDSDWFADHFRLVDIRLVAESRTGWFTIEALDLNRQSLRRLREFRRRLADCDKLVSEGVLGLRHFHIDQLPPHVRGRANGAIKKVNDVAERLSDELDELLRKNARSALIDEDPEADNRADARATALRSWNALYPGNWRAPRSSRKT